MQAVDTNVVVRYLTRGHPVQSAKARAVIDAGHVFVSTAVLLECEWVLRAVYGFAGEDVAAALRAFAGPPSVSVDEPVLLAEVLDRVENGMDFADALHLGAAAQCQAMLTFDRRFIEMARNESVVVVEP